MAYGIFFGRILPEVIILPGHRPETADLPEEPFHDGLAAAVVLRQKPARLLRQEDQDSAELEDGEPLTSVSRHGIEIAGIRLLGEKPETRA